MYIHSSLLLAIALSVALLAMVTGNSELVQKLDEVAGNYLVTFWCIDRNLIHLYPLLL